MELGMVGLGRMGGAMAERLLRGGHHVTGFALDPQAVAKLESAGGRGSGSLAELCAQLAPPRVVWLMIPAGDPVERTVRELLDLLAPGDVVVDGGNSNFRDSMRRAALLEEREMHLVDCGTSGGVWGLDAGYCLMIGGPREPVERLRPLFETLAPGAETGWAHVGPSGAGHFVKMVHNGVEYGMMQAYAEGFALLRAKGEFELDLHAVAETWRHGSVVRSWLLDLIARALAENPGLEGVVPAVGDSGEGRWTVFEAIQSDVPAPVITLSLISRLRSRDQNSFADRLLAAMRYQFGGHLMRMEDPR